MTVPRVFLHGEVGSLDEVALGLAITMVLVVDALIILAIWRVPISTHGKTMWSIAIFLTHFLGWAAYAYARAQGKLQPPPPAAAAPDDFKGA